MFNSVEEYIECYKNFLEFFEIKEDIDEDAIKKWFNENRQQLFKEDFDYEK